VTVIEAAGGVLWRDPLDGGARVEVAVVHRPKYDDWSLPKGKLDRGEHPVVAAVREVREETGFVGQPGRPLPSVHYLKDGTLKRVRYWAMRTTGGEFTPNDEVDEVRWLSLPEAVQLLSPDRDRVVVDGLDRAGLLARTAVVVRHASAGEREAWTGDDRERPLDATGRGQADGWVDLLRAYQVGRLVSADIVRCLETLEPYAESAGLDIEPCPLMTEAGFALEPDAAANRLRELATTGGTVAVCSQGGVIPGLVERLGSRGEPAIRKAGAAVVHLDDRGRLLAVDRFTTPTG
jgi:8-oxo-(d)GTP phosphatase